MENKKGDQFRWMKEFIYSYDQAAIKGSYVYIKRLKAEKKATKEAKVKERIKKNRNSLSYNKDVTTL